MPRYLPDLAVRIPFVVDVRPLPVIARCRLGRWPGLSTVVAGDYGNGRKVYRFSLHGLMAN